MFDPGLGQVRAGFLVSRYGFDFRGDHKESRKNKQREKNPAPDCGTYSGPEPRVKEIQPEKALKHGHLGQKGNGG